MQAPIGFNSEYTYQNIGYFHPHEDGVTYTNDEFETIFVNQYFIPNYIKYLVKELGESVEASKVLKELMRHPEFVQLGVFYMRAKSVLMMFEQSTTFMEAFISKLRTKEGILTKRKLLTRECLQHIHNLPTQNNLDVAFEYSRVVSQLLIIHIIANTMTHNHYFVPKEAKPFIQAVEAYNNAYTTSKLPMLGWGMWAVGFLVNFGASLCVVDDVFEEAAKLLVVPLVY